jgi:hypothetical protein
MPLTEDQINRLVYEIGEDEARALVYRMIIPLDDVDAMMAETEALWWIEEENEAEDDNDNDTIEYSDDEPDDVDENPIITDSNGQTQQAFEANGTQYIIWNRHSVRRIDNGVQVATIVDGTFFWA